MDFPSPRCRCTDKSCYGLPPSTGIISSVGVSVLSCHQVDMNYQMASFVPQRFRE